jgi:hypothetical protein
MSLVTIAEFPFNQSSDLSRVNKIDKKITSWISSQTVPLKSILAMTIE